MMAFHWFQKFFRLQASSGILLLIATIAAVTWVNSAQSGSYFAIRDMVIAGMSVQHWVNDALMSIFFFFVGLEIKRELTDGELSTKKAAALPAAAALGGMIIPALLYSVINYGEPSINGWGIPMATDIAFAVGFLSLLGNRIPLSLKVFLTAFAIVDDLGAVLIIALFYTNHIKWSYLLMGLGILGGLLILNKRYISNLVIYLVCGVFVWFGFHKSGVHATVAGVLLAMVIPNRMVPKLEHALHPAVSFGIMPIFALFNAGLSLENMNITNPVSIGIFVGLVMGKQVGITLFSWLAVKLRIAELPNDVRWSQLYGVAWLGGIGFTMSLFIATLAFGESTELVNAKFGILLASAIAGIGGVLLMKYLSSKIA